MNLKTVTFGSLWTSLFWRFEICVCPSQGKCGLSGLSCYYVSVYEEESDKVSFVCPFSVSISLWQWPLAGLPCADLAGIRALPAKDGPELCVRHSELAFAGSARHASYSQGQVLHVASPRASGTHSRVKVKHTDRGTELWWGIMCPFFLKWENDEK